MLSITKLNNDEIDLLISIFGIESIRKYFQKYPQDLRRLTPLRAKSLTSEQIYSIIHNNLSSDFIYSFMQNNAEGFVRILENFAAEAEKEVNDKMKALIIALADSPFKKNVSIFFKLKEENINEEYIKLVSFFMDNPEAVKILAGEKEYSDLSEKIDELTNQLEEKDSLIVSSQKKVIDIQKESELKNSGFKKELDEANETIAILRSELESLKAAEQIPEEEIDDGYAYHSLCEVFYDYSSKIWLRRLADIEKNVIFPFECDEFKPKLFGNRNKLYHKNGPDTSGIIGVWAWNATENRNMPNTDYIVTSFCYNIIAIQIIEFPSIKSIDELVETLKNGIEIEPISSKLLLVFKINDMNYSGILCSNKEYEMRNGILKLNDDCYSLNEYSITQADIVKLEGKLFYKYLKIKGIPKIYKLYDPIKIVTDIVLKRASWNAIKQKGVSKTVWKMCRDYISELPQEDLFKEICDTCKCSESEAHQYVASLIENAEIYINNDNIENEIISNILPKHPELIEKCKELVYQDWKNENEAIITESNRALHLIETQVSDKKAELEKVKEKLASDVYERIKDKIDAAKKNAAEFISQMAFVSPISSNKTNTADKCYNMGKIIEGEDVEEYEDTDSLQSLISEELLNAGVSDKYSNALAAYLYSAFLTHTPVLLAGPCGKSIANAFSSALDARLAGVLNCSMRYNEEALQEIIKSEDKVIVIENPFSSEWVYSIMDLISASDKFFVLVTPFIEDLTIEPKGLTNYLLPVFTELFVESIPTNSFVGSKPAEGFIPHVDKKADKRLNSQLLQKMKLSLFAIKRIKTIVEYAASFYDMNEDITLLLILLPYAYITQSQDKLLEKIHNRNKSLSKISNESIKIAELYLGEYDE